MKYTCKGGVRGTCGVTHRSREAAERCCERDQQKISRKYWGSGAYSDRFPEPLDEEARDAEETRRNTDVD